jgi:NADH-quinone oxidoreductase subunit F
VDLDFARASGLRLKESGTIEVDRFTLETSRPHFFAGGDVITGASNVSNAMAYGKQAARNLDLQLMEANRWEKIFPVIEYGQTPPAEPSSSHRHNGHVIAPSARSGCDAEVVTGLGQEEVLQESCRCLRCDVKAANPS